MYTELPTNQPTPERKIKMTRGLLIMGFVLLVIVLLLLGPMIYGIFQLDPMALRIWAVVVTLALPCTFGLGYAAGHGTAKTAMDGLETGVNAVTAAAREVADIRDRSFKKTVQHAKPQFNVAMLPQLPQVTHHQLTEGGDTVDL
jgi:hypothetical protein